MLGAEGVVRLVVTIGLVVVGSRTPGPYGLALVLPPIVAMAVALRGQKRLLEPGPTAPYSELSSAIGYLLLGSVLCQALSYSAYLVAISLETHAQATKVGKFAAGILIARIPILGFQAVQAALLPKLARPRGRRPRRRVPQGAPPTRDDRARGRESSAWSAASRSAISPAASCSAGEFTLGNRDLGLLAVGSGGFIFALTLAQALIALRSYAAAALSWLAGAVGCGIGIVSAHDLFLRSELSFGVGAVFAAVAMLVCLAAPAAVGRAHGHHGTPGHGPRDRAPRALTTSDQLVQTHQFARTLAPAWASRFRAGSSW